MKVFCVHVKFPSGFEHDVNIMPGSPLVFPNRELPAKNPNKRAIATMEDAIEYAMGTFSNGVSPIELEWPSEVTPVSVRDGTEAERTAVVKRLMGDPGKPENGSRENKVTA